MPSGTDDELEHEESDPLFVCPSCQARSAGNEAGTVFGAAERSARQVPWRVVFVRIANERLGHPQLFVKKKMWVSQSSWLD